MQVPPGMRPPACVAPFAARCGPRRACGCLHAAATRAVLGATSQARGARCLLACPCRLHRNILADKPRVTKFNIDWDQVRAPLEQLSLTA